MIFVSGTKRSGTSMWMQLLAAAGIPVLGKEFPRNWDKTSLREANPDGFYESVLRHGVYYRTNPHPATGHYFLPEHVSGYAVKVFVPGVVRSERAYIDVLIANVREWREYEASIQRLYALEDRDREQANLGAAKPFRFPPAYEWWMENFALARDISLRRYPALLQTYDQVVRNPVETLTRIFERLGTGDCAAAIAAVKPGNRTQTKIESESVPSELATIFDEFYRRIEERKGIDGRFLETLNRTNRELLPRLAELQQQVVESSRSLGGPKTAPEPIAGLPNIFGDDL